MKGRPKLTKPQQALLEEISAPELEDGGLYIRTDSRDMRTAVALVDKGYATRHWSAGLGGWGLFKPASEAELRGEA